MCVLTKFNAPQELSNSLSHWYTMLLLPHLKRITHHNKNLKYTILYTFLDLVHIDSYKHLHTDIFLLLNEIFCPTKSKFIKFSEIKYLLHHQHWHQLYIDNFPDVTQCTYHSSKGLAGSTQSKQSQIELPYRYKRAKTSVKHLGPVV